MGKSAAVSRNVSKAEALEPIALVDLDGTTANFDGALKRDVKEVLGGTKVPAKVRDKIESLIKCQDGWWEGLEPIQLGMQIVAFLASLQFKIVVLTKGPNRARNAWSEKARWVDRHLGWVQPHPEVMVVANKGIVYGKVLVDDWPEYIERWLAHRPRGIVLMPDQPWNRDYKRKGVYRIKSGRDLTDLHSLLTFVRGRACGMGR